jgi:hypothetical protein
VGTFFLENAEEGNRRRVFPCASVFISSAWLPGIHNFLYLSSFSDEEASFPGPLQNKSIRIGQLRVVRRKNLRVRSSEEEE